MKAEIIRLELSDFHRCGFIWDMREEKALADQFRREIREGVRTTYLYTVGGESVGEVSLVTRTDDPNYTVPNRRVYLSRLIVREDYRGQGIGRRLIDHAAKVAAEQDFRELSVGVNLDNYPALRLYHSMGFDTLLYVGEDQWGRYVKLLKRLYA
jgi:ribosomal protein S18 acetylase RimI-like enzyme